MRLKIFILFNFLLVALPAYQSVGQECAVDTVVAEAASMGCVPASESAGIPDQSFLDSVLDADNGISFKPVYYGEVFTNAHGGITTKNSTHYEGLLDLAFSFDLEKMQAALPGRVNLLFQNTHGRGLEQNVGATQIISNIDSLDNITQFSELWWEVDLYETGITMRVGRQDLSSEFVTMDTASDFINSAFGLSPSAGLPSFPAPSPAVIMMTDLSNDLSIRGGIWDAYRSNEAGIFSNNGSALFIGEFEYRYSTPFRQLPGIFTAGVTYETPGAIPAGAIPSAFGYYFQIEQMLFREPGSNDENPQGLTVFAQHFPTESNGNSPFPQIPKDVLAGLTYTGLINGRDKDIAGAGLGWVELQNSGTNEELMVEVFYKAIVNDNLTIQPDLQYFNSPSGIYPDAFVAGVRFQLDL
ncbi:carbohydrate porin [Gimesia sp.]|uniref:carbohydrate porin n=1 Tax=Gimesia sp. TaxID=2024833 RepID=UPI003A958C95